MRIVQHPLDEGDLTLIHALQIRPRGTWSELASVLGESGPTLAARWARLRADGAAWITAYPLADTVVTAFVEVDIVPGLMHQVCAVLDVSPWAGTIEYAARGRDLLVTIFAKDFAHLSEILLDELGEIPGVAQFRTHIAARIHVEGSRWQLGALGPRERAALRVLPDARPPSSISLRKPTYAPLLLELARDGRATAADIAARIDRPASTVRRQLGTLLRSGGLVFRCEIAQRLTRWPVTVTWWCRVPASALDDVVERVRREPRVRLCMTITGTSNFLLTMWTASMTDLMASQRWLEDCLGPSSSIADTAVTLRTRKRLGWMVHPDGRATGVVYPPTVALVGE